MDYGGGDHETAGRDCACGCLAVRLARVCGLSLQPLGCTSALTCDIQRYCSCSCACGATAATATKCYAFTFYPFTICDEYRYFAGQRSAIVNDVTKYRSRTEY